jgi:hypothetical protein
MKCKNSFRMIIVISMFYGCWGNGDNKENQDTINLEQTDTGVLIGDETTEVIYFVSNPGEIVEVLNEANLSYKSGLIHDFAKADNYLVQSSQALNLGVYSADLAYCAFYDELSEAASLFFGVQELCKKLEISYLIDNNQILRVKNNLHSPDSIKALSKEYDKQIHDHFIENGKENTLTLISTGGFVESLYLALNCIDQLKPKSPIAKALAEQKYVFEVLRDYVYQNKNDKTVALILDDIKELDNVFSEIKPSKIEKTTVENKNGKIIVGGSNNLVFGNAQFIKLKAVISKLRNKYINL